MHASRRSIIGNVNERVCEDSHAEFAIVIIFYKTKWVWYTYNVILRIDGSIMAGVFLTSSFCVVPESSGSSNAASSSLFVHVELGTRTGLVQLIALSQQCMTSFKDLHIIGGSRRYWQLFISIDPYTVVSNQFRLQLLIVKL